MGHAMTANAFFGAGIQELSFDEINAVFGGNTDVPPGTCPEGYVVQSKTYDGNGRLTSVTCVPSSTMRQGREMAETGQTIVSVLNDVGEWISSWF